MLIPLWVALIVTLTAAAYSVTWDLLVATVDDREAGLEGPECRDTGGGGARTKPATNVIKPSG